MACKAERDYKRIAEQRTDKIIDHFNRRWTSVTSRMAKFRGPFSLQREFRESENEVEARFHAYTQFSPNNVSIALSFFFSYDTQFAGGPSVDVRTIPLIETLKSSRRNTTSIQYSHNGKIKVDRFGRLLFEAGFEVEAPNSTGEHTVPYLNHQITIGKEDRTFIRLFKRDLDKLVFTEDYPVTQAIDLAFRMYAHPPKSWLDLNPIPYPLEDK